MTTVLERPTEFNECLVCKLLDTRLAQIQDANPPLEVYITKSTALWNARLEHAKECTAQMDLVLLIEAATGTGGGL